MTNENGLAPFLRAASQRYKEHDSAIAGRLCEALKGVLDAQVVEEPAHVPVCARLPAILGSGDDALLKPLAGVVSQLHWRVPGQGKIPHEVANMMAAVEIVGPSGMIVTDACRFGLFIQSPEFFYPEHCHEAEELYLILSGTALWHTDEIPERPVPPGTFVRHAEWEPHVMTTQSEPLLAMWGWTGNLDFSTYTMGRRQDGGGSAL